MEPFGAVTLLRLATSRAGIIVIASLVGLLAVWGYGAKRYHDGVLGERLAWTEKVRREAAHLAQERAAAQARIDQLAAERLSDATDWAVEKAALQAEIEKEDADAVEAKPGYACAPALSRGLSERLDRIGR